MIGITKPEHRFLNVKYYFSKKIDRLVFISIKITTITKQNKKQQEQ